MDSVLGILTLFESDSLSVLRVSAFREGTLVDSSLVVSHASLFAAVLSVPINHLRFGQ